MSQPRCILYSSRKETVYAHLRCVYTRDKFEVRQVEAERMHKWSRDLRQPRPIRRTELRHSGLSQLESVHEKRSSEATRMRPLVETGKQGSAVLMSQPPQLNTLARVEDTSSALPHACGKYQSNEAFFRPRPAPLQICL
jgi:hypothetical protein